MKLMDNCLFFFYGKKKMFGKMLFSWVVLILTKTLNK